MNNVWKPKFIKINGKKFILGSHLTSLQCACCLYLQPAPNYAINRDRNGMVKSIRLDIEAEQHTDDCKQKEKSITLLEKIICLFKR